MKASDFFIKCLEEEDVEYIFGLPGEETSDLIISLQIRQRLNLFWQDMNKVSLLWQMFTED